MKLYSPLSILILSLSLVSFSLGANTKSSPELQEVNLSNPSLGDTYVTNLNFGTEFFPVHSNRYFDGRASACLYLLRSGFQRYVDVADHTRELNKLIGKNLKLYTVLLFAGEYDEALYYYGAAIMYSEILYFLQAIGQIPVNGPGPNNIDTK